MSGSLRKIWGSSLKFFFVEGSGARYSVVLACLLPRGAGLGVLLTPRASIGAFVKFDDFWERDPSWCRFVEHAVLVGVCGTVVLHTTPVRESIPESLTARLLNVVVLDVHSNQLKLLPNSIGCLSKLKVLNVSGNLLESLPKSIEDCRTLEELNANFNKLAKLPDTMGFELANLRKLSVNSNKLAFLPYSTSHMTSLKSLDARLNCLRSLPEGLENLIHLEILNISQNFHYLESIPDSLGHLVSLVELDISYNKISRLPNSIGCLTKLRKLHAEGNPLVFPPIEVVEQSADAVRDYLNARMNDDETDLERGMRKKNKMSWFGKIVRCGTFSGGMRIASRGVMGENDGFLLSDYRSIDGLATPRHGMLSPLRIFSPKRSPFRK